jgi:hypothetical protein
MQSKMKKNKRDEGWQPNAPSGEQAISEDERSLDVGESGQFAPGGSYSQQGVNRPDRSALDDDEDIAPSGRR